MATVVHLRDAKRLWGEFRDQAMPYIRQFRDKTMVVKVGGSVLHGGTSQKAFLDDVIFMAQIGIHVVLVHGGSRHLTDKMRAAGIEPQVRDGERYTDRRTLAIATSVFNELNAALVDSIRALSGQAIGLRAGDSSVIFAKRKGSDPNNYVGTVTRVDAEPIRALKDGYIPVLTCIGSGDAGEHFNINADEVASRLACELHAAKLILLTNVDGVNGSDGRLISTLTAAEAERLMKTGVISSGMIPKVRMCLDALRGGVRKAHILNGSSKGSLLCEVLSDTGVGTEIVARRTESSNRRVRTRQDRANG
ncbi:MAG: acetylglutamate kinase [Deltaproteobacteria bacterium]|nr:acetylglutamate kinase [Deltaproteobacteria bacterium]